MSSPGAEPLCRAENLSRAFRTAAHEVAALRGVSFSIPRGARVGVMGPSGSGKSTLLGILGCLDRPTSGRYLLDGRDVAELSDDELSDIRAETVGFVFQSYNLIAELDVLESICLPLEYRGVSRAEAVARARHVAGEVGLGDRLDHRPWQLSGGEQQRVAIARAYAGRPRLLLADEPTGNLDSETSREIVRLLLDLNREGVALVVVTHNEELAPLFESVLRIRDGRLVG
ncbi:MAG TPA: ABC transporter ATP-binding protein [Thermoanaerobaculia bacterium]|nr:ABC transporter ATP-binding protein [Thermoanaerobaculia bacterium]